MMWPTELFGKKSLILREFKLQISLSETSGGFTAQFWSSFSIIILIIDRKSVV